MKLDWLKKNLVLSVEEKRSKIDTEIKMLSVRRQCELLGLSRSAYYYQPVISQDNIRLMSLIDEEFTAHPFYGKRRIYHYLRNMGEDVNIKKMVRLIRLMGLLCDLSQTKFVSPCEMVERLWRSVKYEEVYLKDYHSVKDAQDGLKQYFKFYNEERLHQTFGYRTPSAQYHGAVI